MELIISRKKKDKLFLRINRRGYIVVSKGFIECLRIEDPRLHGLQFGYLRKDAYIAFCDAPDRYQGNFRADDGRFGFFTRQETEKLAEMYGIPENETEFVLWAFLDEFTIYEGVRFYKLTYEPERDRRRAIRRVEADNG